MLLKKCKIRLIAAVFGFALAASLLNAQTSDIYFQQGLEAYKSGNFGSAELLFRKVIEKRDSYQERGNFYLAACLFRQDKYDEAIFEFNRFQLLSRNQELISESRFYIAESYYLKNDFIKAIEEYKRFISIGQKADAGMRTLASERIGTIYYNRGRFDEALIEWKNILPSLPKDKADRIKLKIAEALYQNGQYAEALEYLDTISTQSSAGDISFQAQIALALGIINTEIEKPSIALRNFARIPEDLLSKQPYSRSYYYSAKAYFELSQTDEALKSLNKYFSFGESAEMYDDAVFLNGILSINRDPRSALESIYTVFNRTKNNSLRVKTAVFLSKYYIERGRHGDALPYLEFVAKNKASEEKEISYFLGEAYIFSKKYDKAEKLFLSMAEKYKYDNDSDRIFFMLSVVYFWKKDKTSFESYHSKISEFNQFSPYKKEILFYKGVERFEESDYVKSENFLREYVSSVKPKYLNEARNYLFRLYVFMNDPVKSGDILDKIIADKSIPAGFERLLTQYLVRFPSVSRRSAAYTDYVLKNYRGSESFAQIVKSRADDFFKKGNFKLAETEYTLFLDEMGNDYDIDVYVGKVLSLYNQKKYQETIDFISLQKLKRYDEKKTTEIVRILALSYYNIKNYERAYSSISVISDKLTDITDYQMIFDLSLATKDINAAVRLSNNFLETPVKHAEALYRIALFYENYKNEASAKEFFIKLISDHPDNAFSDYARIELSKYDMISGFFNVAESRLLQISNPKLSEEKDLYLSETLFLKEQPYDALKLARAYSSKRIKNENKEIAISVFQRSAEFSFMSGSLNDLDVFSRALIALKPESRNEMNLFLAKLTYEKNDFRNAYNYISRIDLKANSDASAYYIKGMILLHYYKNIQSAVAVFTEMQSVFPEDDYERSKAEFELARIYYDRNENQKAVDLLSRLKNSANKEISISSSKLLEYYDSGR
ncbi:MAG: tetratricopeptide repeat protein [Spirochaetes bacterium]|nr:tetratricopeptide repeat protein [Spirochaetota bacterium]